MTGDIENIIYSEDDIRSRVTELAARISADYAGKNPMMIGVLKGSFIFLADLVRSMDIGCEIRFLSASSYGYNATTSGVVQIACALDFNVCDCDIIIVEDILDTGTTLKSVIEYIKELRPASLRLCVLLDKPARREADIRADYIGFECPDGFLVGYGLDYAERYRNLPYIAALRPEVYSS